MSTLECPKCNSKNFSTRMYSLDEGTGKKIDITGVKPSSNLLAILLIIMAGIPSAVGGVWLSFLSLSLGSFEGGMTAVGVTIIAFAVGKFANDTFKMNRLMKKRTFEHVCNYCKTSWNDKGDILELHEPEPVSPSSAPSEKVQNQNIEVADAITPVNEVSQAITPEKSEKVDDAKLCPRCYMESSTFFICKECGYVNKTIGGVLFLIAAVGLAIGIHGLLAWIAGKNALWVEIVKTLLCGLPGVILAYWGISEVVYVTKSRQWAGRHNHDMTELLNFYKENPNASIDKAGKFLNHTGQWVELMLSESKAKKE